METWTRVFNILLQVLLGGLGFYLLVWLIGWIGFDAPFDKVAKAIIGIAAVIYLFAVLTGVVPRIV